MKTKPLCHQITSMKQPSIPKLKDRNNIYRVALLAFKINYIVNKCDKITCELKQEDF